jgi:uncharacterized protein (TIGR02271 family)
MRFNQTNVRAGMTARSTKGDKLGKVVRCDGDAFIVEKGAFFHKDYELYYEYVTDVHGDEVVYALDDARLSSRDVEARAAQAPAYQKASSVEPLRSEGRKEGLAGAVAGAAATLGAKANEAKAKVEARLTDRRPEADRLATEVRSGERLRDRDTEMRIPLMEEQLAVERFERDAGHVRIHKEVKLEERHVTVPVRREEVVIEHVPGRDAPITATRAEAFREETIDLPISEEEIRVSKHPVVREELRVRRVSHEEQRDASATLRHEEVEIEDTTTAGRRSREEREAAMSATGREGDSFKKT